MENASYARVRLESTTYSSKSGIGVLSAVYVVGLVACLVLGYARGPNVFERNPVTGPDVVNAPSLNVTWIGQVTGMERWHQILFLHMRLKKPYDGKVEYEQRYDVSSWGSKELIELTGSRDVSVCETDERCVELTENKATDKMIKCKSSDEWCGWTTLLTEEFVEYPYYHMKVNMVEPALFKSIPSFYMGFEMVFITKEFTKYQMFFHYTWVFVTLCFIFLPRLGFFYEMYRLHQNFWSRQQVRVGALLVALLFFNNVFFAGQIFSNQPRFFFSLYMVLIATFLAMMLFFWLELFSDLAAGNMQVYAITEHPASYLVVCISVADCVKRIGFKRGLTKSSPRTLTMKDTFLITCEGFQLGFHGDEGREEYQGTDTSLEWERNRAKTVKEYLPKLVLIGLIWVTTILVYIYVRVQQTGDPSYSTFDDLSSYTSIKVSGLLLSAVYFAWLGILVEKSFGHMSGMNLEYVFVMVMTLVTIFGAMAAVFTGALAPDQHGSKVFTFFYGMFNIYVLLMAFCYTPAGTEYGDVSTGDHVEMMNPPSANEAAVADDISFTVVESSRKHTML